ncbi:hypothetical protein Isop_2423 [Isosphaera pallida ATCC 43644]|jgi:hypothetical protein|uniref:Uncharacterized protein n=1 Tax=Isosphaera pallida (strain ATCC 43644 / DSM 9630 / IS1B) TaxID=575540 RepID=E8QWU7_ISOPI|nr:hypothetical protein [Isosphaera pallida]ADV62997.1 hypothetical protein Isop_2423 [Isosphaera pallida ATCC 43644]
MAGDAFKKVQPGQRLEITAEAFNAFLDAARAAREHKQFGTEASQFFRQSGIVKVKNASGADRGRFAVLGLTEPIILPANNETEFKRQVTFEGVVPAKNEHKGKFAVLLEPVAASKIGLAVVAGVVPVRLQVDPGQLYDCAEIIDGNTQALRNVPHGSARVLWIEATGSTERWAVVRLDDGDYEAHVLITGNVPDSDGYYPGEVQRYDVDTKTWQTLFECKVLDINQ